MNKTRHFIVAASLLLPALVLSACGTTPQQLVDTTPTIGAVAAPATATTGGATASAAPTTNVPTAAATVAAATATKPPLAAAASPTAPGVATPLPATAQAASPTAASGGATPIPATEQPVAPEQSPAGDIPDTQAFVPYSSSAGGYQLDVPEGWARSENGASVSFIEKLDGVSVTITNATAAPAAATLSKAQAQALLPLQRAVQLSAIKDVQLGGGSAVLITYTANSDPNSVTGKQVRLDANSYLFFKNGKLAILTLWAPLGADNVDQWQRMSGSMKWTS